VQSGCSRPRWVLLIVILSGGYLWRAQHAGSFGHLEQYLGLGVAGALALAIQLALGLPALRALRKAADDAVARRRLLSTNQAAAVLLAVATIAMATARYA
jgi:hypothetical protein